MAGIYATGSVGSFTGNGPEAAMASDAAFSNMPINPAALMKIIGGISTNDPGLAASGALSSGGAVLGNTVLPGAGGVLGGLTGGLLGNLLGGLF